MTPVVEEGPDRALLEKLLPLLPKAGITRLADVTGLDCIGLPVVLAVRPLGRSLAVSQGKGLTPVQARIAAVLEALELHHAERHRLPTRYARAAELARDHRLADLDKLPRRRGARGDRQQPLLWVEGSDFRDGGARWLPYELVHADFTLPQPAFTGTFPQTTNGLGAGASRMRALRHALLEVIERDGLALLAASPVGLTARLLDLSGVDDPACRFVLDRLSSAGLAAVAVDATSDIGIATVSCRLVPRSMATSPMAHVPEGSAADPVPERALLRALLEAVQARLTFVAGTRDDLSPLDYVALDGAREHGFWLAHADADLPRRALSELQRGPAEDDAAIVAWTRRRLAEVGLDQVIAVDLDDPEFGIPVVRVIVPGLEPPPHPTHLPGRRALAAGAASP